ncbi:MAG TPA: amidase [Mycobacteriales bacterium]|nr:amidase [Mycobacteriales bacterium]
MTWLGRTAAEIAAAVRDGDVTASEVVEEHLDALAGAERLGAVVALLADEARADAKAVDANTGKVALPLAGVPVAIKDVIGVAGHPTRLGSLGTRATPATADHLLVQRLRTAGAIPVAITAVPELCIFGFTDGAGYVTRNPWNTERTPGGSSGGSAALVGAGLVPIAHATDGMGSVRIPAACCGLLGLKPASGLVPYALPTDWRGLSQHGPLATTVADLATMVAVMADEPSLATVTKPGPLRIGISTRHPLNLPVAPAWKQAPHAAGAALAQAGHTVDDARLSYPQWLGSALIGRWTAAVDDDVQADITDPSLLQKRSRRHAAVGRTAQRLGLAGDSWRARWKAKADAYFATHDVLLTPSLAQDPVPAKAWSERGWVANVWASARYAPMCAPWNFADLPAIAVPLPGLTPSGSPLSVQLVARDVKVLLGLAAQLEEALPWERTAPA